MWETLPNGCATASKKNCLGYTDQGTFTRMVAAGDTIGTTGKTSRVQVVGAHLHLEIWFGGVSSGLALDPAYFYDDISNNAAVNEGDMYLRPSVTKSGESAEPSRESLTVVW